MLTRSFNYAVAIVPARRNSAGLPGKNWRDLCGKPLVRWSVEQAIEAGLPVWVTSDAPEVWEALEGLEYERIDRPAELCGPEATTESALMHALTTQQVRPSHLVLLQPTSPLRTPEDIKACLALGNGVSVVHSREWQWPVLDRVPRQRRYALAENGSIYSVSVPEFMRWQNRTIKFHGYVYWMPSWTSHEIDDEDDFAIVELMMRRHVLS